MADSTYPMRSHLTDWNAIVVREGPTVWSVLWKLLGVRADVEESFQETFLAAIEISRREAVESWPALLTRLATMRGIDRLRLRYRVRKRRDLIVAHTRQLTGTTGELASTGDDPAELAVAAELSERLREALTKLPEKQAEIFVLHVLHGWNHRELAERMQMNENAVRTALHRARGRLRELLDVPES